jgi:acyl carrier protein
MEATVTKDQIEERVTEALVSFGADRGAIAPDARWEQLDIDSLDLVELAQIVEDEYGVQIREEDLKGIENVGQSIDFVAARTGS